MAQQVNKFVDFDVLADLILQISRAFNRADVEIHSYSYSKVACSLPWRLISRFGFCQDAAYFLSINENIIYPF